MERISGGHKKVNNSLVGVFLTVFDRGTRCKAKELGIDSFSRLRSRCWSVAVRAPVEVNCIGPNLHNIHC